MGSISEEPEAKARVVFCLIGTAEAVPFQSA